MKLTKILDRPIAYHRCFVDLTGSVKAAVLLSQAVYWQARAKQADGYWYKTAEEWQEETGLTKAEQRTARKQCEKYLKSDLRGVPATMHYKVDEGAIQADLFGENVTTSSEESEQLEVKVYDNINKNTETTQRLQQPPTANVKIEDQPLDWQIMAGVDEVQQNDQKEARRKDTANLIAMGCPAGAYDLVYTFLVSRDIDIPESKVKGQRKAVREMMEMGVKAEHVRQAVNDLLAKQMTFIDLFGVSKTAIALANQKQADTGDKRQHAL